MSLSTLERTALEELDLEQVLEAIGRRCVSESGRDVVLSLHPFSDVAKLRTELTCIAECLQLITTGNEPPFERLSDVRQLLKKSRIEGNFLSAPELLTVFEAMQTSRKLKRFAIDHEEDAPYIFALCEILLDDRVLERHITDAIDDTGLVRDSASRELQSIRREIHELEARLRQRLQRILKKFGEDELLQEEFITQRDGRFVLPLRVENKRAVDGIIHGVSQTGSTVFFEPAETYELNNELSLLKGREQREIIKILTTLTAEVSGVSHHIEAAFDTMSHVDSLIARARHALDFGGIKPWIVDEEFIELTNVRHPILVQNSRKPNEEVIPLSIIIDSNVRGILISGPNAGGKTVAMKTIGLALSMAYSGIYPLGTCTTNLRRVFTAIGDHQSIESNLSTFSSQIIRIRDVMSECSSDAFVLIDEICAGTDPAEGGALAAGILDSILERSASFIVTTHQSSLKQYALTHEKITNASLAFDEEQLQPTFRFQYGVPGNSYAFDLAHNVGLPEVVLTRAKGYLGTRHDELEESISAMQKFRKEAEQLKTDAAIQQAQAEKIRTELEERLKEVKAKRSTVVEDARAQAAEILQKANALVERTIREIKEGEKSIAETKREFQVEKDEISNNRKAEIENSIFREVEGDADSISTFRKSDFSNFQNAEVRIKGASSVGNVLAIEEGIAVVDVNGIKFRVSVDQLEVVGKKGAKQKPLNKPQSGAAQVKLDITTSLDMRGMRADEGLRALELFLDDVMQTNIPFVSVIHGKGDGVLRSVVHKYLKERPGITSFRIGSITEGGDGITIVEL